MLLFDALDSILDLPFSAFQKKLAKLEQEFQHISFDEVGDEELDQYFLKIQSQIYKTTGDAARVRIRVL